MSDYIAKKLNSWPNYDSQQAEIVKDILLSNKVNYWTGNIGKTFEKKYAEYVGVNHAIAVTNGTVALDLALKALDLDPSSEVIVTSRSFVASASCVFSCGLTPVFADVDLYTQNITAETIQELLTPNTKAIICVHLAGNAM